MKTPTLNVLLTLVIWFVCFTSYPQQSKIDSVEQLLANYTKTDTVKISYLNSLSELTISNDLNQSLKYAREADSLANIIGFTKGKAKSALLLARCYTNKSDFPQALKYCDVAMKLAGELRDSSQMADSYIQLGIIHEYKGEYSKSEEYYLKSLGIYNKLEDKMGVSNSYNNLGAIRRLLGNYPKALEFYQKSMEIFTEIKDKNGMSMSYNNIGIVYYYQQEYSKALEFYEKSLEIDLELENQSGVSKSYNNLAVTYFKQEKFSEALNYYQKSLEIKTELDDKQGIARTYLNIADNYYAQEDYLKAEEFFKKSLNLAEEFGFQNDIAGSLLGISKTLYQLESYAQAKYYGMKGYSLASEMGIRENMKDGAKILSQVFAALGQYKTALDYQVEFKNISDSLLNSDNIKKITRLEEQYKFEKERQAIMLEQNKKDEIQSAEIAKEKTMRNMFIVAFFLSALVLFGVIRSFFIKKKALQQLAEKSQIIEQKNNLLNQKNEELTLAFAKVRLQKEEIEKINFNLAEANNTKIKLFQIISHDLRSPISSLVQLSQIMKKENAGDDNQEIIELFASNSEMVLKLVENLLEWARLQSDNISYNPELIGVKNLIKDVLPEIESLARNKEIKLETEGVEDTSIFGDKNMLKTVIRNLLSNAIKFTDEGGKVSVSSNSENDQTLILVEDSGIGMSEEQQEGLFDIVKNKSTPGTKNERGTGLGLVICKEFVERNGGKIWVDSKKGMGTKFWISLPHNL